MNIVSLRPPRIGMGLAACAALLHWGLDLGQGARLSFPGAGMAMGIAGFGFMMWAWLLFRKRDIGLCPTAPSTQLAVDGPFRFTRNPMYLGMVLMMGGLSLIFGTLPFYGAAIGYLLILNSVFCPYEERKLAEAFGKPYLTYRSRVRRWL
jgi:protein-S-isoprenylcysteine O-methyltransferase Ste14